MQVAVYAVDEKDEKSNVVLPGMVEAISRDLSSAIGSGGIHCSRASTKVSCWMGRASSRSRPKTSPGIRPPVVPMLGHGGTVIDAFTGAGGNAIQFACMNFHVIAIDIDPKKIEYARNNARVYDVEDRIDFIVGDFFQLAPTFKADVVFLSPPWGGPEYIRADRYDIKTMLQPADGFSLFKLALSVAPNVAYFLPKTVDPEQMAQLSRVCDPALPFQIEKNYVQDELKAVTVYYGDIAL